MVQRAILKIQISQLVVMKLQIQLLKKLDKSIYSVVGGGDTIALLNKINLKKF